MLTSDTPKDRIIVSELVSTNYRMVSGANKVIQRLDKCSVAEHHLTGNMFTDQVQPNVQGLRLLISDLSRSIFRHSGYHRKPPMPTPPPLFRPGYEYNPRYMNASSW